jgi:Holliday junction DNA helicase RuvA
MIGFVRGRVAGRTIDGCFVDVGGVGYRLVCSATTFGALPADGAEVTLFTHVHAREDHLGLFGFATEAEQQMFELLIAVNGVGPKVALQVCSALAPDELRRALVAGDVGSLSAIPGIGKKTAQRISLELKEKLSLPDLEVVGGPGDSLAPARSALENLGYSPAEVRAALSEVHVDSGDGVEDVVRSALKMLAGGRLDGTAAT